MKSDDWFSLFRAFCGPCASARYFSTRFEQKNTLETIGSLIETYETNRFPETDGSPTDVLNFLMSEHGLKQSELPEIGSQGVISEIIGGKRQLNVRQIKLLSKRFNVSPAVFL